MSYGFVERAPTMGAVLSAASTAMATVVAAQPIHAKDSDVAMSAAESLVELIGDAPEGKVINLSVSGSIMTMEGQPYGATLSVNAYHEAAAPGGV